jgi:hypothetical protein
MTARNTKAKFSAPCQCAGENPYEETVFGNFTGSG